MYNWLDATDYAREKFINTINGIMIDPIYVFFYLDIFFTRSDAQKLPPKDTKKSD